MTFNEWYDKNMCKYILGPKDELEDTWNGAQAERTNEIIKILEKSKYQEEEHISVYIDDVLDDAIEQIKKLEEK